MAKKLCTGCKERFDAEGMQKHPAGWFHDFDCAIAYANRRTARVTKSTAKKVLEKKRRDHKADKERVKTRAKWLAELQALVNQYVRLRDAKDGCICCDKPAGWNGQFHAGHFYPQGRSSALRFNLWNIHKQASSCNNHKSGNLLEYKPKLIAKIGQARFDHLEARQNDLTTYDVEWLKRAIKIARRAIKREKSRYN